MCFLLGVSMRKKVDDRIHTLIQNGANARHRSLFVVIGDKGRDQVDYCHLYEYITNIIIISLGIDDFSFPGGQSSLLAK